MVQLLASPGLLPDRPIRTPLLLAAQGSKGRAVAKEIADGLMALSDLGQGFDPYLVSVNGTVLDPGEPARARGRRAPSRHNLPWHVGTRYRGGQAPAHRAGLARQRNEGTRTDVPPRRQSRPQLG